MSEAQLQSAVIELAGLLGWMVAHFRPAMVGGRWVTAMQGNPGYPDLTMARKGRVIFAELKAAGKKPTGEQRRWLTALDAGDWDEGIAQEVYTWQPKDWLDGTIERVLRGTELP